ncbi:Hint domain-containing protein [Salipiger mucosus]|uniref:Hedgehog/Intein (Hint) domain-containing protein n=1 Tax=Salipiger mucosus DSM 16094 TaxID=1123237 RepID=S9QRL8_9RHOB|nr:Hint domain-containing protein [Salipiger mucosus]EPX82287.1 hypothetical protein Salmuc_03075 [Salipiger mucosus DSM 16094]
MATYSGTAHFYQNGNLILSNFVSGEVISDDGGDSVFTPGEVVDDTANTFVGTGTFVGTIDINGFDYPIFSEADSGGTLGDVVLYVVTPAGFDTSNLPSDLGAATASSLTECFLTGTRIATPSGETEVEKLRIGDEILTAEGNTVPVRWIGRQRVVCAFAPAERLMPVRIRAGALGDGLPRRDLRVTADHALLVDGLLVNASALVNGAGIDWVPLSELGASYTVYHVETEAHDLILAEGTAAETYIDYVARRSFDNHEEYRALYGEETTIAEMPLPRISAARLLPPALRARLAGRSAA